MSRDAEEVRAALNVAAPAVRRFLFGLCGCWHQADDLTQDALLKAWHKRHTFDGRAAPKTWIFRIARNEWLERLRRRRVRPKRQALIAEEVGPVEIKRIGVSLTILSKPAVSE